MTSTNFCCGYGNNTKNSSKVLKPPGGGSSDIFAAEMQTPRSASKNHLASNIFAPPEPSNKTNGESGRRNKTYDSHNRLFGDVERPYTPAKNHMKSNIPIGSDGVDSKTNGVTYPTVPQSPKTNGHTNGKLENGGSTTNSMSKPDGNPITGEGYKSAGINKSVDTMNGANQVINKNRVPPGGFSSGLW